MQTPSPSRSRKRRGSDQYPFEEACHPKQPAIHQDSSPAISLDRYALRALQQEYTQAAGQSRAHHRIRRPVTRLAVAEWRRCQWPLKSARAYLENCEDEQYKALQTFSKHGGPDLRDLRGCRRSALCLSNDPMAWTRANTCCCPTDGETSNNSSPYNRAFQQKLIDAHIYPPHYTHPDGTGPPVPETWFYINERLARSRPSLSPSNFSVERHQAFVKLSFGAAKEAQVKKTVIPMIEGTIKNNSIALGEIPFTNLLPLAPNEKLMDSKPDIYHGAHPAQLERQVRDDLEHLVIPSTQHGLPIVPNHFTAVKGPEGILVVATKQATHDAFFGARAMHALQNYGQGPEPRFDGKAYTFSSTYCSDQLIIYTSHPTQPVRGQTAYHITQLRGF